MTEGFPIRWAHAPTGITFEYTGGQYVSLYWSAAFDLRARYTDPEALADLIPFTVIGYFTGEDARAEIGNAEDLKRVATGWLADYADDLGAFLEDSL